MTKQTLPELSATEWILMKKVWELGKTSAREVYEELLPTQGWAFSTVRTMLERLCEKGYLEDKKVGNMYFYLPRATRKKTALTALDRFVDKVFDGAIGPLFTHLLSQDKLTPADLAEIRKLIEKEGGDQEEKEG